MLRKGSKLLMTVVATAAAFVGVLGMASPASASTTKVVTGTTTNGSAEATVTWDSSHVSVYGHTTDTVVDGYDVAMYGYYHFTDKTYGWAWLGDQNNAINSTEPASGAWLYVCRIAHTANHYDHGNAVNCNLMQ